MNYLASVLVSALVFFSAYGTANASSDTFRYDFMTGGMSPHSPLDFLVESNPQREVLIRDLCVNTAANVTAIAKLPRSQGKDPGYNTLPSLSQRSVFGIDRSTSCLAQSACDGTMSFYIGAVAVYRSLLIRSSGMNRVTLQNFGSATNARDIKAEATDSDNTLSMILVRAKKISALNYKYISMTGVTADSVSGTFIEDQSQFEGSLYFGNKPINNNLRLDMKGKSSSVQASIFADKAFKNQNSDIIYEVNCPSKNCVVVINGKAQPKGMSLYTNRGASSASAIAQITINDGSVNLNFLQSDEFKTAIDLSCFIPQNVPSHVIQLKNSNPDSPGTSSCIHPALFALCLLIFSTFF